MPCNNFRHCNIFYDNKKTFIFQHKLRNKRRVFKAIKVEQKQQEEIALKIIVLQSLCSFFVESFLHCLCYQERGEKEFAKENKNFCVKKRLKRYLCLFNKQHRIVEIIKHEAEEAREEEKKMHKTNIPSCIPSIQ